MRLAGALCLLLAGCATSPRVYRYEALGFEAVVADPSTVDRACRQRVKTNDYGKPLRADGRLAGCYMGSQFGLDQLWIAITDPWTLIHELCHLAGLPPETCAKEYSWNE